VAAPPSQPGAGGLTNRSSRPHRSPRKLADDQVARIVRLRARRRYEPHRLAPLTGHPPSTIYHALRRAGMSRLAHGDRLTAAPVRYVACNHGALLHVDHALLHDGPSSRDERGSWRSATLLGDGSAADARIRSRRCLNAAGAVP
jgi:hypothetical protein